MSVAHVCRQRSQVHVITVRLFTTSRQPSCWHLGHTKWRGRLVFGIGGLNSWIVPNTHPLDQAEERTSRAPPLQGRTTVPIATVVVVVRGSGPATAPLDWRMYAVIHVYESALSEELPGGIAVDMY